MLILILGVALWAGAHLYPRLAADGPQGSTARRGVLSLITVLGIVLMIFGYRSFYEPVWWGPSPALVGINNLLVLIAIYLFAAAGMKTRITSHLRHPMLTGFILWAVAHLLVNGDLPSFLLFGGLLAWALAQMVVINRSESWQRPTGPFPVKREIIALIASPIVMLVIGMIHAWLGYWPFGG